MLYYAIHLRAETILTVCLLKQTIPVYSSIYSGIYIFQYKSSVFQYYIAASQLESQKVVTETNVRNVNETKTKE